MAVESAQLTHVRLGMYSNLQVVTTARSSSVLRHFSELQRRAKSIVPRLERVDGGGEADGPTNMSS